MVAQGEDIERLFEAIPRENIPEKFGGKLKPIDQKAWLKDMEKKAPEVCHFQQLIILKISLKIKNFILMKKTKKNISD